MLWLELVTAGVQAIAAGSQVFADRSKSIAERLEKDPKQAVSDEDREELRRIARS